MAAKGAVFLQIIITTMKSPKEYISQFRTLEMVRPEKCPICGAQHTLHKHGSYWRNILNEESEERIPIARLCCKICKLTISMLPSFALPYFQYSLKYILRALQLIFLITRPTAERNSGLLRFYRRRFYSNVVYLEMFFRDQGWSGISPREPIEKATKMVCMLTVPTAETLSQRFHQHHKRTFMAHSLYHN